MDRRHFLQSTGAVTGLALLGSLGSLSVTKPAAAQASLYGPLGAVDANGLQLPAGFTSRIIAESGQGVGPHGYLWHPNPDGGATFASADGGWIYVSNNEGPTGQGGVSMVRFDVDANVVQATSILFGTARNCAGGSTPWGTWLSCEEVSRGQVWECDPRGFNPAQVRPAMGAFAHEAAAADPENQVIYLTEDKPDSLLYRFTPTTWGDLSVGLLEGMTEIGGVLGWAEIPTPDAPTTSTRHQIADAKRFNGGEGAWFDQGLLYFTTKGDSTVWRYDSTANQLDVIYAAATSPTPILTGVDNVTVSASGDIFVCEDGGNMEVVVLGAEGAIEPFLRMDIAGSEVTGVAFDPSGTRMYVSSQRNPGTTFEITGPFRQPPCELTTVGLDTTCGPHGFTDVPPDEWYSEPVTWAACTGVTAGTSPTTFSPHNTVTRAQVATFLWRYATEPAASPNPFTDVPPGLWYSEPIDWLYEAGITAGTSPTIFSPSDPVTRAQMATFLWRLECEPSGSDASEFDDVDPGLWYSAAVDWLAATGITAGTTPTTFSPHDPLTRATAVTFLWRLENTRL